MRISTVFSLCKFRNHVMYHETCLLGSKKPFLLLNMFTNQFTSSAVPPVIVNSASSSQEIKKQDETSAQAAVQLNTSQSTTSLQIRLADGSRFVISIVRSFYKNVVPFLFRVHWCLFFMNLQFSFLLMWCCKFTLSCLFFLNYFDKMQF